MAGCSEIAEYFNEFEIETHSGTKHFIYDNPQLGLPKTFNSRDIGEIRENDLLTRAMPFNFVGALPSSNVSKIDKLLISCTENKIIPVQVKSAYYDDTYTGGEFVADIVASSNKQHYTCVDVDILSVWLPYVFYEDKTYKRAFFNFPVSFFIPLTCNRLALGLNPNKPKRRSPPQFSAKDYLENWSFLCSKTA